MEPSPTSKAPIIWSFSFKAKNVSPQTKFFLVKVLEAAVQRCYIKKVLLKMVWLIGIRATVCEIFRVELSKRIDESRITILLMKAQNPIIH